MLRTPHLVNAASKHAQLTTAFLLPRLNRHHIHRGYFTSGFTENADSTCDGSNGTAHVLSFP